MGDDKKQKQDLAQPNTNPVHDLYRAHLKNLDAHIKDPQETQNIMTKFWHDFLRFQPRVPIEGYNSPDTLTPGDRDIADSPKIREFEENMSVYMIAVTPNVRGKYAGQTNMKKAQIARTALEKIALS